MFSAKLFKISFGAMALAWISGASLLAARVWREAGPPPKDGALSKGEAKVSPSEANKSDEAKQPTDRCGDPLPEGALDRLGTIRFRHRGPWVDGVAYSPDGKIIASAGGRARSAVSFWDAATGKELHESRLTSLRALSVAFSPDSKTLAAAGGGLHLIDVATGKVSDLAGEGTMIVVAFSPDGKTVASGDFDGTVQIWDLASGKVTLKLEGHKDRINSVCFSPDGKTLASASHDTTVRLWNLATGTEIHQLKGHHDNVAGLASSPDGKTLASGAYEKQGNVRLWDVTKGKELRALDTRLNLVFAVAFSPDCKTLAVSGRPNAICLFDVSTGKESRTWETLDIRVHSLAFSPDGKTLVSGGQGGVIRRWDPATGKEINPSAGHSHSVCSVAFAADGKLLFSFGRDKKFCQWDLASGEENSTSMGLPLMWWIDCAVSADNKTLAVPQWDDKGVYLWDIAQNKKLHLLDHESEVAIVAFLPDGKTLASGTDDGWVYFWDVVSGNELRRFQGPGKPLSVMKFSPDGTATLLGASEVRAPASPNLELYETATGKEIRHFDGMEGPESACFSPDGKMLAVAGETKAGNAIYLWDLTAAKRHRRLEGQVIGTKALCFSPNGKLLVSSGEPSQRLALWDVPSGKLVRWYEGRQGSSVSLAFSPNGRVLACGRSDTTILLWDVTGRQQDGKLKPASLTPKEVEAAWTALADDDAAKALKAVWELVAEPEKSLPYLKERIHRTTEPDEQRTSKLIADLDSDTFDVRARATADLHELSFAAEPALRKVLDTKLSLETRKRIEQLLEDLDKAEWLRYQRAIEVLEQSATPESRQLLEALAKGAAEARTTREAKAALQRIGKGR